VDNDLFSVDRNTIEIFSPEERDEINARIEAASARDAVTAPGLPSKKEASRRDLFPILVNAGAMLLLASGLLLLFNLQRTDAVEIRESGAVLGLTERALIREIRNEAKSQLAEKDTAIDAMNKRIEEVDVELRRLDSLETLTDEQRETMEELRNQEGVYRESLAQLQIDKAKILTSARIREAEATQREANLRGQIREQAGMLEDLSAQSKAEIENARNELVKLSGDAEKTALVEKQLSGFYANISRHIENRQYNEAADGIAALKEYLATPSLSSIKAIRSRQESDAAAVNSLSVLLSEAEQRSGASPVRIEAETPQQLPPPDTSTEDALRRQVAEQAASIARQNVTLSELQKSVSDLQIRNDDFLKSIAERESQLENLKAQNVSYAQTIETLQKTISNVNAALESREPTTAP
jgi:chromosome segregation ATPase